MLKKAIIPGILAFALVVSTVAISQAATKKKTFKFTRATVALGLTSTTDTTIDVTIGKSYSKWLGRNLRGTTVEVKVKSPLPTKVYIQKTKHKYVRVRRKVHGTWRRVTVTRHVKYWKGVTGRTAAINALGTGSSISVQGLADRSKTNRKFYARKIWIYSSSGNTGYGY